MKNNKKKLKVFFEAIIIVILLLSYKTIININYWKYYKYNYIIIEKLNAKMQKSLKLSKTIFLDSIYKNIFTWPWLY